MESPYKPGENWFFRLSTNYIIGTIEKVGDMEITLKKGSASWVATTGRFHNFLKVGIKNKNAEIEPYGDIKVVLGRLSVADACEWMHEMPTKQQ